VWRLDLAELRWERMSDLTCGRAGHACCTARDNVVVLAGQNSEDHDLATVEVLRSSELSFTELPPLSCGPRADSIALPIDESESAEGQVLMLGGCVDYEDLLDDDSRVLKVDLATGACTPQPPLLYDRVRFVAERLPDGRVVCAGGLNETEDDKWDDNYPDGITAEVPEPPAQGSPDGAWRWRELPRMSIVRESAAGCVLRDGRFAVFEGNGGSDNEGNGGAEFVETASCEVLTLDGNERWEPLPPMREVRSSSTCAAVGGCVIVAGGDTSVEVYEEGLGR
jgi:hypothetical protein